MKRYWLFAGSNYYPLGGMDDKRFEADTLEECHSKAVRRDFDCSPYDFDWWHIYDTVADEIVNEGRNDY